MGAVGIELDAVFFVTGGTSSKPAGIPLGVINEWGV